MPSISFATGLLNGYFSKQAEERDRKEKNALAAANFLLSSGRVRDYNDLLPILDQATGGTGGGKGKGGIRGGMKAAADGQDPHSILAQFINPILKGQQGQPGPGGQSPGQGPGPSAGPGQSPPQAAAASGPAPGPTGTSVPTGTSGSTGSPAPAQSTSPAPAAPATGTGPLMSDDELADRDTAHAVRKEDALQTAKEARANRRADQLMAQNPGMTRQDALEVAYDSLGMKWPAKKTDQAKTAGKPIPGASLPDNAKTVDGKPIPADQREGSFQPVLVTGTDGPEVRYTPGAAGNGSAFTGGNLQIYQRIKAAHPDWPEDRLTAETARQADALDRLKQSSMVVKLEQGKASDDDVDALADQLVDGTLLPANLSRRDKNFNHLLATASKKSVAATGKPVNFSQMALQYGAAQRFAATLNGANIVRFRTLADSVVNTIDEVNRLADELKQGGVQLWNKAKQSTIRQVYGNTPQSQQAVQYLAAINTLKEEFANLVNGGYAPTEPAFALANQQINGDYGVKDLQSALTETQRLINYRTGALDHLQPISASFGGGSGPGQAPPPPGRGTAPGAAPPNPFRQ